MAAAFVAFSDDEEAAFATAGNASVAKNSWAPAFDGNALVEADDEAAVFAAVAKVETLAKAFCIVRVW